MGSFTASVTNDHKHGVWRQPGFILAQFAGLGVRHSLTGKKPGCSRLCSFLDAPGGTLHPAPPAARGASTAGLGPLPVCAAAARHPCAFLSLSSLPLLRALWSHWAHLDGLPVLRSAYQQPDPSPRSMTHSRVLGLWTGPHLGRRSIILPTTQSHRQRFT